MKRKLFLSYFSAAVSMATAVFSFFLKGNSFLQSDFWSIASLIFSDFAIVARNWKEFTFSMLENFPVFNAIFILVPVFALLYSINWNLNINFKKTYGRAH